MLTLIKNIYNLIIFFFYFETFIGHWILNNLFCIMAIPYSNFYKDNH